MDVASQRRQCFKKVAPQRLSRSSGTSSAPHRQIHGRAEPSRGGHTRSRRGRSDEFSFLRRTSVMGAPGPGAQTQAARIDAPNLCTQCPKLIPLVGGGARDYSHTQTSTTPNQYPNQNAPNPVAKPEQHGEIGWYPKATVPSARQPGRSRTCLCCLFCFRLLFGALVCLCLADVLHLQRRR